MSIEVTMSLKAQVAGLNRFLTVVYDDEMRLSTLLANLGFDSRQVRTLQEAHAGRIVNSFIALVKQHSVAGADGERLYLIMSRRFGLDGDRPATLETLGQALGISRERVRQLQGKALRRCRGRRYRANWVSRRPGKWSAPYAVKAVASSCETAK